MALRLKTIILQNAPIKLVCLLLGYGFWYLIAHATVMYQHQAVPLVFYNVPEQAHISAPPMVTVHIKGTRRALASRMPLPISIYLDAREFTRERTTIALGPEHLWLPQGVDVVHYEPSLIEVAISPC